ncbi:MAG: hypothetical protein V2B18_06300 [Pseudomonadota bacterium]
MTFHGKQWKLHSYITAEQGKRLQAVAGPRGISPIIRAALDLYFKAIDKQERPRERSAA